MGRDFLMMLRVTLWLVFLLGMGAAVTAVLRLLAHAVCQIELE